MFKNLVSKNGKYFQYFYSYLGYKIFILASLSFFVGLLDGFGLALFIPLIQSSVEGNAQSAELGSFNFLLDWMNDVGISLSLTNILLFMTSLFVIKGVFKFIDSYYKVQLQIFFVKKLRFEMLDGLGGIDYQTFAGLDAGRIQNTLSGEVYKVTGAFLSYFNTLQYFVLLAVYFGLAMVSNWQFAILVSVGGYVSNIFFKILFRKTETASVSISKKGHQFQSFLIQAVQHFKYLKATSYFNKYRQKLVDQILHIEDLHLRIGFFNSLLNGLREPIILVIVVIVITVQINLLGGEMSTILLSLMFFYRALNYVISIQSSWQLFISQYGGIVASQEMIEMFNSGIEQKEVIGTIEKFESLELKDVSFGFKDGDKILSQIRLDLRRNDAIAFVGPSGSGKTTIVNLLVGLLEPTHGDILLNGRPRNEINFDSFRTKIGYITQEPVIFNDSVFNNITFWAEKNDENIQKFWHSVKLANLSDFVKNSKDKEDTMLGDNGIKASGGQKQRISIARELFKEAEVIVFDEATSALDSDSEKLIQENINSLQGKYTLVMIAHRLSTIRNVDRIYLINGGHIQSSGSFTEMMNQDKDFKRMVQLQEF